jgi:hypothetical protein
MGLFSSNSLEDNLKKHYIEMFLNMGMSASEAKETVSDLLKKAKEQMIANGEDRLPADMAERFISDPKLDKQYRKRKNNGVTDDDFRWWYGMTSLERSLMLQIDEMHRMNMFLGFLEQGKSIDEATDMVFKYHPIFGDSDDTSKKSGDDRPLHAELKDRINIYIEKCAKNDPEQYKKDIENSSSFNALIRKEIKAGNL